MTLPKGWISAKLGEVTLERVKQGEPGGLPLPYIDIGSIDRDLKRVGPTERITGANAPTRARQWVRPGDVLVSLTRPNLNAVAMVPPALAGAIASTGFDVLRTEGVLPAWVFNRVRSQAFVSDVSKVVQGVVYPAIRPADVRRHELPIPPLHEQRRIVEAIDSYFTRLDDTIGSLERVQAKLKAYRASVLKVAVEGRLVPTEAALARAEKRDYEPAQVLLGRVLKQRRLRWEEAELAKLHSADKTPKNNWRERYLPPLKPNTSMLPDLPEGWCWTTVEMLSSDKQGSICAGPFGTIFKAKDFRDAGVPIIFLRHVKPDRFLKKDPTFMDEGKWNELFREYSVYGGELLVTKLGDPPGDCAVFPLAAAPSMLTPDVMKLDLDMRLSIPRYTMHYINSTVARRYTFGAAFGTTRLRLTLPWFRAMPVPLPPIAEQERIVERIDLLLTVAEETEASIERDRKRCGRLQQAILKWAFVGRLADQDATDEPAERLLARIRAEQPAIAPDRKNGRRTTKGAT